MPFRLDGKMFFLTYPQCHVDRHVALDLLKQILRPHRIDKYCVAQEKHQDGNPHLHILLLLDRRKSTIDKNYFDIAGHHGNYQIPRNRRAALDYCLKSDNSPLCTFSQDEFKLKMKREDVARRIISGEAPRELVEEYPTLLFGFNRLLQDIRTYEESKIDYDRTPTFIPNPWGFLIPTNNNKKRRHWWIYSTGPNYGKTTWARSLESDYGAYIKSSDFSYWNVCGREQLVIFDEYNTAGMRFNTLNQICDGTYEARVFMGGNRRIRPKVVIVLSNVCITDIYPHMFTLVQARFIEKKLD